MGTRNLTMVISRRKIKVAQYGQWDGYPEGQGKTILEFLKRCNLNDFRERVDKVSFVDKKVIIKAWQECFQGKGNYLRLKKTENIFNSKYPEFSRDTGAKILNLIYEGKAQKLFNNRKFVFNNLFCEWLYLINLDKNLFEIYTNQISRPIKGQDNISSIRINNKAIPLIKMNTYTLHNLPTLRQFIKDNSFDSKTVNEKLEYDIITNHNFEL